MWILQLNDMRSSNIENLRPVFRADTKEQLKAYLASETVAVYRDDGERVLLHTTDQQAGQLEVNSGYKWSKQYRKGGPLEWFNPPFNFQEDYHFIDVGTEEDWANRARQQYAVQVLCVPSLP